MSVLSYLNAVAGDALHHPAEKKRVDEAVATLRRRLRNHFDDQLLEDMKFGSAVRGTNLPKEFADEMDVDYLVVFRNRGLAPRTVLAKLNDFAQSNYRRNNVFQSSPAIVIALSAVRLELVPARRTLTGIFDSHEIPSPDAARWVGTTPLAFQAELAMRNQQCDGLLKSAIRLMKMWNAANEYVFSSYRLENIAVGLTYWGDSNLKHYFCRLMRNSPEAELQATWRRERLRRGKMLLESALDCERGGNRSEAELLLDVLFGRTRATSVTD